MTNALNKLEYYYENEAEQYLFYRVPQMLFTDKRFSKISSDAKLLYSLFLNRMSLSRKNGMFDEEKRVYIYFSIEEVMEVFGIASQKATKIIAELDDVRGCGLIHRKKSGQGKPARIYVMKYTSVNEDDEPEDIEINDNYVDKDSEEYMKSFILEGTLDDPKIVTFSNNNTRLSEIKSQDFPESKNKTFENQNSKLVKSESQDFRNSKCSNNKYNNTEINNTEFNNINPILSHLIKRNRKMRLEKEKSMKN